MGSGGQKSMSSKIASWETQTVQEQIAGLVAAEYDANHKGGESLEDRIPNWVLDKKLSDGERYAFSVGDGAYIKRESDKAYLIANKSDFGEVSFWMPKTWMSTPEKIREDYIQSETKYTLGSNYNQYLQQMGSNAGIKMGNAKSSKKAQEKLTSKGVKFMTKEEFANSKGYKAKSSLEISLEREGKVLL